jgi:hypothetical protein
VNVEDVRPGRYKIRGDVVDVEKVRPGKTLRSARVEYVLREKVRPRGALNIGERGELGIVNLAAWATPIAGGKHKR